MEKLLFYDMDNTLAEMSRPLVGISSGRLLNYHAREIQSEQETITKLHQEGFFQNLTIIQNSQAVLRRLVKTGYTVKILSQPMVNNHCIDEKNYWLEKFFPFIPRHERIYTFDKYLLANTGRVLVDDNISHLADWEEYGGIGICFQRGYNKNWKGYSIKYHKDIFQILEEIWR